jgi:hydrogenase/urease accessory protein HupE
VVPVSTARAHPAPFSYLDLRLADAGLSATLTLHNLDVAHELGVDATTLLDQGTVDLLAPRIVELVRARLALVADGEAVAWRAGALESAGERDAVTLHFDARWAARPGRLDIGAELFPYDPAHQAFVNVYEDESLRLQDILAANRPEMQYFSGSIQGTWAVVTRFVGSGIEHIFGGSDHVAFIVGLLLVGGSLWRLLAVMTAFTLAHSVTLSLAALDLFSPPARIIEPAIALSIVYVGADNLLTRGRGRDVRLWVAFVFGLVHGFGFASVLKEFGLPRSALGWALASFNVGVEVGQAAIVLAIAPIVTWLQRRRPAWAMPVVVTGSVAVAAAGAYWFLERSFGP